MAVFFPAHLRALRPIPVAVLAVVSGTVLAGTVFTALAADEDSTKLNLAPVAITANPLGANSDEMVTPVSVLNGRELSLRRESTLGETLNGTPGVSSSYFGPNASRPVIRGLDCDRIRLLQNGVGILDASSLSPDHAVALDPLVVEQIDVVRGPAALLYGGSAVGGVVNAIDHRIPKEQLDGVLGRGETRFGGAENEKAGVGVIDIGNNLLAIHADAYYRDTDDLDIPGYKSSSRLRRSTDSNVDRTTKGTLPNSSSRSDGGALGASLTFDNGYIGTSYSAFNNNYGTVAEEGVRIDMNSTRWDLASEFRDLGPIVSGIKFNLAHTDYEHQEIAEGAVNTTFKNRGTEGRLEVRHGNIGPISGVVGLQVQNSQFAALGDEALIPRTASKSQGLYIYEELPLDALKLSAGARFDHASVHSAGGGPDDPLSPGSPRFGNADTRKFNPFSYSTAALYQLNTNWALSGNLAHTERTPTYNELYANGVHEATGQFEIGNPDLEKERSNGLDAQLRWKSGHNSFSLSGYYTRFSNYLFLSNTGVTVDDTGLADPAGELAQAVIRAVPAVFKGFEAEGKFRVYDRVGNLDLNLRGDYVHATNRDTGDPLPRIAPLRLGFGLDYTFNKLGARLDVLRAFKQNRNDESSDELPTDGYTLVNALISYRLPTTFHLEAYAKARNLLDQDIRDATSVLKEIAPMGGRSLLIGLRGEF